MEAKEITAFLKLRGHNVVQTESCWWYNEYQQQYVYHSFPIQRLIAPQSQEIKSVFRQLPKAAAIRFLGPPKSDGHNSFVWLCRNPYDFASLSVKARNKTRQGLAKCRIEPVEFDELENIAQRAHTDTMNRQKREYARSLGFGKHLKECSAYEAWGAFVDNELAAFMLTQWVEDWVHILLHRSANAYLRFRPNNALLFTVVKQLLSRPGVTTVSYGTESLANLDSLDDFKRGMGFVQEPVAQRIVVAPRLKLFVNPFTSRSLDGLAVLMPNNSRLKRLAGFCRVASQS